MHSAGLELTKLIYTMLEDNLIRHRGDRRYNPTPDELSKRHPPRQAPLARATKPVYNILRPLAVASSMCDERARSENCVIMRTSYFVIKEYGRQGASWAHLRVSCSSSTTYYRQPTSNRCVSRLQPNPKQHTRDTVARLTAMSCVSSNPRSPKCEYLH